MSSTTLDEMTGWDVCGCNATPPNMLVHASRNAADDVFECANCGGYGDAV
jgi:hypothetical protein